MVKTILNEKPTKRRFLIIFCLFIGIAIAFFDRVNVSVLAANDPFLLEMGIKGEPVQIGMMMSVFLAVYGIANISLGTLGDVLGPRIMMTICVIGMLISIIFSAVAATFMMFIIGRIILGISEGTYYPQQNLFVRNWIPVHERGRANACWCIGQAIGPAIAMPLLIYVMSYFGWRANFYLCAVLTLIPLCLFWFCTTDRPQQNKGVNKAELTYIEKGMETTQTVLADSEKIPLVQRWKLMIANSHYWVLVIWYVCLQFVYWGLISWIPAYLKVAKGFSWVEMGWMASLPFIVSIFTKILNGYISDKIGRCAPLLFSAMLVGTIFLYLTVIVPGKYLSGICLAGAVGFTVMATPIAWTLMQGLVPSRVLSTASGTMNGIATGFSSLSPIIMGFFIGITGNYNSGMYCLMVGGVIGMISGLFLMLKKY
ncbi:MFS transporter [Megasphaera paucivorans]|uniref:Sugar phosphate permease n=1 Tax=Megasphaera paucivorans TaxID=349095 RepID=A0A1H0BDF3_9FIRM|nr:MFS transporter [Megasphaera paucivorans]SDN43635.1 Sugar phosphate permease [Megasphaera paucivorans]